MRLRYVLSLILLWVASACSEAAMQNAQKSILTSSQDKAVTDEKAGEGEREGQTSSSRDENPSQSQAAEGSSTLDPVAANPVIVSGAYLVCIQSTDVDCRVDSDSETNIAVDPGFQLQFFYQGQAVTASESKRAGWRWKLNPQALLFGSVEVRLQFVLEGVVNRELSTVYEVSPMQIGDGSTQSVQPGCNGEIGTETQPFALEFIKSFKLEEANSIVIDMIGVCGIVLSNDAYIQVSNSAGREVFKRFLPSTKAPADLKFVVPELAVGDYSLRIHASDKYEIDDFYIRNLSISLQAR